MDEIEQPNAKLLDREHPATLAQQHYASALAALQDMVAYGTNLIIRAYHASDKGNVPMVTIGVLLKQVVSMLDAVDILMRQGASYPALLQVRAAFEASLYIDFILQADSEQRARHYIIGNLRGEAEWAKRAIPGTAEKQAFDAAMGDVLRSRDPQKLESDGRQLLAEVQRIVAKPEFQGIDAAFTAKRGRGRYDRAWYEVVGARSVKKVAELVGRQKDYEVIYGRGSNVLHAGLYKDQVQFRTGGFIIRPLRTLTDAKNVFNFAMLVAVHSFQVILSRFRPEEMQAGAFGKRYLERWRGAMFSIPEVTYNYV